MFHIKRFTLNNQRAELSVQFSANKVSPSKEITLSYEFIRVLSPQISGGKQGKTLISHKKQVQLLAIESVGKHGYRFIFDDQHSAIYSESYLDGLCQRNNELWQQYLNELKASGHSREAMITITEL
ncbi:MAG: gamma-butyrobetaine hydroxylase-like domain-containing protein [Colwellia sp.]|nr:gamma-butyrobetaine hydroxylase-like domain-containing protein [Colwellia sp.]